MSAAYPLWPAPCAYLYGYVDTSVVGYRSLEINGSTITVPSGYYAFWAYVDVLNTELSSVVSGSFTHDGDGSFELDAGDPVTWGDRIGALLGYDAKPGDVDGDIVYSRQPPLACIPLAAAEMGAVRRVQDLDAVVDRHGRSQGSVFGAADLWRVNIEVHHSALRSLESGWCLGGQVVLSGWDVDDHIAGTPTAWSASNPTGYLQGYVVAVEGGGWVDELAEFWRTTLLIARAVPS